MTVVEVRDGWVSCERERGVASSLVAVEDDPSMPVIRM